MTISMQQNYKIIQNNDKKYRIRNTKKRFMVDEEKYSNANNEKNKNV